MNVYLKLAPDNAVTKLTSQFHFFLKTQRILAQYHLTPFIKKHPLHITLYLTDYDKAQLATISKRISAIAQHTSPIIIKTDKLEATSSMYTLLSVINSKALQQLSNEVLLTLMPLRDRQTKIPAWAKPDKNRREAFARFGSPNVLENFSPHFSLLAATHLNKKEALQLQTILTDLIKNFSKIQSVKVTAKTTAIGIGITNSQGQITKELFAFPLNLQGNTERKTAVYTPNT